VQESGLPGASRARAQPGRDPIVLSSPDTFINDFLTSGIGSPQHTKDASAASCRHPAAHLSCHGRDPMHFIWISFEHGLTRNERRAEFARLWITARFRQGELTYTVGRSHP